jgi:hypothetical protein
MTKRLKGFVVVLESDMREDDAEQLRQATACMRNALKVEPIMASSNDWIVEQRVRTELGDQIMQVLYPNLLGGNK